VSEELTPRRSFAALEEVAYPTAGALVGA